MKSYQVTIYHNVSHAYVTTIKAEDEGEAGEKAIALWEEDGGEQFTRVEELDYQGDVEIYSCEKVGEAE